MRVRFPDGVEVQARGLSGSISTEGDCSPDWGLYLDGDWEGRVAWPHRILNWPDFSVPPVAEEERVFEALVRARDRAAAGECVEIGCTGGTGRTGTALACLAVLADLSPAEAIEWVRIRYHPQAIETKEQEDLVARFAALVGRPADLVDTGELVSSAQVEGEWAHVVAIKNQLESDLDRWEPELANWVGKRGTLWHGIFDKACQEVERLILAVNAALISRSGDTGQRMLGVVGKEKPLDRLTLGQHVDLLRALDRRRILLPGRRILGKANLTTLDRIVARRNDFEHGRLNYSDQAVEVTLAFLGDVRALCHSPLMSTQL